MVKSHKGAKFFIATVAQSTDLADAAAYAALTWTQVNGVGEHGETGLDTNILSYDGWDTSVRQKSKGTSDAGDPTVEVARDASDAGQDALRAAAATESYYAFKIELNDSGVTNPTTFFNRGLVTGPKHGHGRNEDFDLEVFTLGLVQAEIVLDAA